MTTGETHDSRGQDFIREIPGYRSIFVFSAVLLLAFSFAAAQDYRDREVADSVIERTYPDGRMTFVVNGTELRNYMTGSAEQPPKKVAHFERQQGFVLYQRHSDGIFRKSSPQEGQRFVSFRRPYR